jgi:SNF2 family DNA or RNA helicase
VPKFFGRFRDEVMTKITPIQIHPKPDAVDKAFAVLQPAVRFTLDDVVELPERIERTVVDVEMGPKQAKIYKALVDQCYAAVQSKEITAANAGAVMMKLLQVSTGWVYAKDRDRSFARQQQAHRGADGRGQRDRPQGAGVRTVQACAGGHLGGAYLRRYRARDVSGDTPPAKRAQIFNLFQNTTKYRVIAAHPQCLAHGITLTAADTVIWFAPVTSLEIYDQANHRIRRVGQKHKQLVLHLQSTPVEKKIYRMLQGKQKVQNKLLQLFEEHTQVTAET